MRWLIAVLVGGCMVPPRSPSGEPGIAIGLTTPLHAKLTIGGTPTDVVYWPRKTIAAAQMIAVALRRPVASHCDAGLDLGLGRTGADARCGSQHASILVGAYGHPFHGYEGIVRGQLSLGAHGFGVFASTGPTFATWTHRVSLPSWDLARSLFTGPTTPAVDVSQSEIAWTTELGFAVPVAWDHQAVFPSLGQPGRHGDAAFATLALSFETPFATTHASYRCVDCTMATSFSQFDPGWRLGVLAGLGW